MEKKMPKKKTKKNKNVRKKKIENSWGKTLNDLR